MSSTCQTLANQSRYSELFLILVIFLEIFSSSLSNFNPAEISRSSSESALHIANSTRPVRIVSLLEDGSCLQQLLISLQISSVIPRASASRPGQTGSNPFMATSRGSAVQYKLKKGVFSVKSCDEQELNIWPKKKAFPSDNEPPEPSFQTRIHRFHGSFPLFRQIFRET